MTITNADDGKTLRTRIGAAVNVILTADSGMQPWTIEPPNPAVLAQGASPAAAAGQTTSGYRAVGAGMATIMATDRPVCNPGQICPKFIRAFRATVVVDA